MKVTELKKRLNEQSRKRSLPDSEEVYVRHFAEKVSSKGMGRVCFLIHPDISLEEFFAFC